MSMKKLAKGEEPSVEIPSRRIENIENYRFNTQRVLKRNFYRNF